MNMIANEKSMSVSLHLRDLPNCRIRVFGYLSNIAECLTEPPDYCKCRLSPDDRGHCYCRHPAWRTLIQETGRRKGMPDNDVLAGGVRSAG